MFFGKNRSLGGLQVPAEFYQQLFEAWEPGSSNLSLSELSISGRLAFRMIGLDKRLSSLAWEAFKVIQSICTAREMHNGDSGLVGLWTLLPSLSPLSPPCHSLVPAVAAADSSVPPCPLEEFFSRQIGLSFPPGYGLWCLSGSKHAWCLTFCLRGLVMEKEETSEGG